MSDFTLLAGGDCTDYQTSRFDFEDIDGLELGDVWTHICGGIFSIEYTTDDIGHEISGLKDVSEMVINGRLSSSSGTSVSARAFSTSLYPSGATFVSITPLLFPLIELTPDPERPDWKRYRPGEPLSVKMTIAGIVHDEDSEAAEWWDEAARTNDVRKSIDVNAWTSSGDSLDPAVEYYFENCRILSFVSRPTAQTDQQGDRYHERVTCECDVSDMVTEQPGLDHWIRKSLSGDYEGSDLIITFYDEQGSEQTTEFFPESFVTGYAFPTFNIIQTDVWAEHKLSIKPGYVP